MKMKTYEERVAELEAEGCTRSDAQGVADVEQQRGLIAAEGMKWKLMGRSSVDSGELMIADPCYFVGKDNGTWNEFCDRYPSTEHVHRLEFNNGVYCKGVAASTHSGDGCYPVYGLFETPASERPSAMMVVTSDAAMEFLGLEMDL